MRLIGSEHAVEQMEELILLLLEALEDVEVEVRIGHDGTRKFNAFIDPNLPYNAPIEDGVQSEVYRRGIQICLKQNSVWINYYYDPRRGDRRWGAGQITINNVGVKALINALRERRFWKMCEEEAQRTGWRANGDGRSDIVGVAGSPDFGG